MAPTDGVQGIQFYSSHQKQRAAIFSPLGMKPLPFVLNVAFNFVQLLPEEATRLKA